MTENLLFSLNCVAPYFLLIGAGLFFRVSGLVPASFFKTANGFTFKVALPFQLFWNIAATEGSGSGISFLAYIFVITIVSFGAVWLVTEILYKDKTLVGTLVQGAVRGNFVLLGIPIAGAVMGPSAVKTASLATIVIVPLYNILAVVILTVRGTTQERATFRGILKGIATNPLIIGICLAIPFMLTGIGLPGIVGQTVRYIGQTATPLGLLSVGGMIVPADAIARLKPALYAASVKNLLIPAAVMTVSRLIGYRNEELLILLVLSAAPAAVSSYIMAAEMGGDAHLASNILILTTFISAFVMAAGIYILRMLSLI